MFHKFSEPARRVVFFARYEASRLGGTAISPEHLLLGLLQENAWLVEPLLAPGYHLTDLRHEAEKAVGQAKRLPMSVDMPLGEAAKMALTYADEESARLQSSTIDAPHVLLGLLRSHPSKAAVLLNDFGLRVGDVRLKVAHDTISNVEEPFAAVACAFYGIEIRFDASSEAVPRIFAEYRGHLAMIEIDPVKVIQSDLPRRGESMVLEWATLRKDEIKAAWQAGKAKKRLPPISPLD